MKAKILTIIPLHIPTFLILCSDDGVSPEGSSIDVNAVIENERFEGRSPGFNEFAELIAGRMSQEESGDTTLPKNTRTFKSGSLNATLVRHKEQVWWIENLNSNDRDSVIARLTEQYEQPTVAKSRVAVEELRQFTPQAAGRRKLIQEILFRRIDQSLAPLSTLQIK
jgi:hypothetical protein